MIYLQAEHGIKSSNRALNYGDGFFSTMAVCNGRIALFNYHRKRLIDTAKRLSLDFDDGQFIVMARQQARQMGNGVLKILVSSTDGGRGYARTTDAQTQFMFTQHELPSQYKLMATKGVNVNVSPVTIGHQPLLAGLKHLNRLEQVLVKNALDNNNFDDALVLDIVGNVVESSAGNLFWKTGDTWFTPALNNCGVAGVMRSFILDVLRKNKVPVVEGDFTLEVVLHADCVAITNSLMQVIGVNGLTHDGGEKLFDLVGICALQQMIKPSYDGEYDQES